MIMEKGFLKWFDPSKGFGFCTNESGRDFFLHCSSLERAGISGDIAQGTKVVFNTKIDSRGRRGIDVIELVVE
jgi:cold shock protein